MSNATSKYDSDREELALAVPSSAHRVLDVGCDTGRFGALVKNLGSSARSVYGVEPSGVESDFLESYEEVWRGVFPEAIPPDLLFDCIAMNDVLEHMDDPWGALAQAWSLLQPGGVLVGSVPNVRQVKVIFDLVVRGDFTYREVGIMDVGHLRFFTRSTVQVALTAAGFSVQSIRGTNIPQRRWMYRLLNRLWPAASEAFLARQIMFIASRDV